MESVINLMRGCIRLEARGARPQQFINLMAKRKILFWDAEAIDEYTVRLSVHRSSRKKAEDLARRSMCELEELSERGVPRLMRVVRKRSVLALGLFLCLALLLFSSFFIWDIKITGNTSVPEGRILCALDEAGVSVGSFWPDFVSDNIRSRVLVGLDELSWITVNVSGSQAEVIVRERTIAPEIVAEDVPSEVIAEKAGLISSVFALRGTALIFPGQTVAEGDTIVSGIVNSSYAGVRFEHAMAEVWARTWYEMTAVTPLVWSEKVYTGRTDNVLSVDAAGKNIIFSLSYGISGGSCDKIIDRTPLAIDGVFTLPLAFLSSKRESYTLRDAEIDAEAEAERLKSSLLERLYSEIGEGGEVISFEYESASRDGLLFVTLRAECHENIASYRELTSEEMEAAKAAEEEKAENEQ